MLWHKQAAAQSPVIIPASGVEHSIGAFGATYNDGVVINGDMLEYHNVDPGTGQSVDGYLKAIVYSRRFWGLAAGSQPTAGYLYVEDNLGQTATIQLEDSACNPDVALGEVVSGTTVTYYAVVVYDTMGYYAGQNGLPLYAARKPRIAIYQLNNVGAAGFGASLVSGYPQPLSTTAGPCGSSPHLDMWSDANSLDPYSGLPTMHKYGICWTNDTLSARLYVSWGDLVSAGTAPSPVPTTINNCTSPNIAVLTEHASGTTSYQQRMYITFSNENAYAVLPTTVNRLQLRVAEYTPVGGGPATTTGITQNILLEDSVALFMPRIEAMSQYDPSASPATAKWEVAANVHFVRVNPDILGVIYPTQPIPAPNSWHVAGYNNFTIPVAPSFSYASPMGSSQTPISYDLFDSTYDIKSACVAAGTKAGMNSNIGNNQYTVGYFPWQTTTRYARAVDAITGALVAPTDHYEINNSGNPCNYPSDADQSLALSNCSNSGQDIFSVWYNGTDIVYKHSHLNVMSFRPGQTTGVGTAATVKASGIYPNPAFRELHIDGRAEGSLYQISDVTGKRLLNGMLGSKTSIDVSGLSSGLYLIQIRDKNGITESYKFTKE